MAIGLTSQDAAARLASTGPNVPVEERRRSALREFLAEQELDLPRVGLEPVIRELPLAVKRRVQRKLAPVRERPAQLNRAAEMVEATGWQQHTVRGAMAGALKKKLSLNIVSEKTDGQERKYRIV